MSELWRMSATETATLVKNKEVSAVEVTKAALGRLEDVNPSINAVIYELPEEAMKAAEAVDKKIAAGEDAGPLAGVPVTTKLSVDQKGTATTNGLQLQMELIATQDTPVIANMRDAGAVIIGRTNTPAFSLRWFTRNLAHGATINPHNSKITPGGSSGGASSATAAGIGAIGHGTDIAGSIRYPAYACGLHGLRPTLGRIPSANSSGADRNIGAQLMAVSGPIARTVADVKLGFEVMAKGSSRDPWWVPVPLEMPAQEKKIALAINPSGMKVDRHVEAALRDAASRLEAAGWSVEEVAIPDMREACRLQIVLWMAEFRGNAEAIFAAEGDPDAIAVYQNISRHAGEPDLDAVLDALQKRVTLMREWKLFFDQYPLVLCPVSGEQPFPDHLDVESLEAFDRVFEAQLPQIATPFMGLPGLAVTTGIGENNIPIGVQLLASHFREDMLLAAGEDIESAGPSFPVVTPK
ncbi:MAG: amidase family protein [Rhizobiaceae bacterium]